MPQPVTPPPIDPSDEVAALRHQVGELEAEVVRLKLLVAKYRQMHFGRRAEPWRAEGQLDLPVPFGVAPLAGIGEGKTTGFIRFDAVRDYPLSFPAQGFYDLANQKPSDGE